MSRYRFARRPLWIVSHVAVGILVMVMIGAGIWQLRRFRERGDLNASVCRAPGGGDDRDRGVIDVGAPARRGRGRADVLYRRGDGDRHLRRRPEILIRNRTQDGRPGRVGRDAARARRRRRRSWSTGASCRCRARRTSCPRRPGAVAGDVTVTGLLQRNQTRGWLQPTDPATGTLRTSSHGSTSTGCSSRCRTTCIPCGSCCRSSRRRSTGDIPILVAPPEPFSETQNLSYAFQWFAFTVIALSATRSSSAGRPATRSANGGAAEIDEAARRTRTVDVGS